jgi:hypothetical protein
MSSLEDGFGGGVDDMVSANTGELRISILGSSGLSRVRGCATRQLLFSVPRCQIANGTKRTVPEAPQTGILELHDGHHLALLRHVAAATPSRSHVLMNLGLPLSGAGNNQRAENPAALRVRVPIEIGFKFWGPRSPRRQDGIPYHPCAACGLRTTLLS